MSVCLGCVQRQLRLRLSASAPLHSNSSFLAAAVAPRRRIASGAAGAWNGRRTNVPQTTTWLGTGIPTTQFARQIQTRAQFSPAVPIDPASLPKPRAARHYRRTRKWLRRLFYTAAAGGILYLADRQLNYSGVARSLSTFGLGIMAATATICNSTPSFSISSPPLRTPSSNLRTCFLTQSHPSKRLVLFRSGNLKRRFLGSGRGGSAPRFEISCKATVITENDFPDKVLRSDLPVLVEFVANWCGPCRLIAPVVDWASLEYKDRLNVVKIDHDSNPKLIEEYKVYGLPTLILFKNGQEVRDSRREGAMTKVKLKEYLDTLLETVTAA